MATVSTWSREVAVDLADKLESVSTELAAVLAEAGLRWPDTFGHDSKELMEQGREVVRQTLSVLRSESLMPYPDVVNYADEALARIDDLSVVFRIVFDTRSSFFSFVVSAYKEKPARLTEALEVLDLLQSRMAATIIKRYATTLEARRADEKRRLVISEERCRLSREIHDDTAQLLGLVKLKAALLARALKEGDICNAEVLSREVAEIADMAYLEVRDMILGLRTAPRAADSFVADLRTYINSFQKYSGIVVDLEIVPNVSVAPNKSMHILRIIQEALSNARNHGKANTVSIKVDVAGEDLRLVIHDNGLGYDVTENSVSEGFGIEIMKERAAELGGTVEIRSSPGQGTWVEARLSKESILGWNGSTCV